MRAGQNIMCERTLTRLLVAIRGPFHAKTSVSSMQDIVISPKNVTVLQHSNQNLISGKFFHRSWYNFTFSHNKNFSGIKTFNSHLIAQHG